MGDGTAPETTTSSYGGSPEQEIGALLRSSRQFSEEAIPVLEAHVRRQVAERTYDFAANKALAKLYQFFPGRCEPEVLALVLAKAMMARPATDAKVLAYIVPEALAAGSSTLRRLAKCEALLEASKFADFWECARGATEPHDVPVVDLVPGFADALRRYLVDVMAATFQTVELDVFASALGVAKTSDEAKALLGDGASLEQDGGTTVVRFAPNRENVARQKRLGKTVRLESLLSIYADDDDVFTSPDSVKKSGAAVSAAS